MPLEHSKSPKAFKSNVRTLMGEVGKSPHVQSQKQALAIAYETQRRGKKKAKGGRTRKANGGKTKFPPSRYDPDEPEEHSETWEPPTFPGPFSGSYDHLYEKPKKDVGKAHGGKAKKRADR